MNKSKTLLFGTLAGAFADLIAALLLNPTRKNESKSALTARRVETRHVGLRSVAGDFVIGG
ncbi:MAG: hypothetical protein U0V48_13360 [Anaerolineales bacterium]